MISVYPSPPHPNLQPNSNRQSTKWLILVSSLCTIPFLFYLFTTAQKIHTSSKFAEPKSTFFGLVINAGDPDGAGASVAQLVEFAKQQVPKKEWGRTKVQLIATQELENLSVEHTPRGDSARRIRFFPLALPSSPVTVTAQHNCASSTPPSIFLHSFADWPAPFEKWGTLALCK
ncbi:hypothetical protein K1719_005511 [Acacia pycnantha]|nr:hypothetical protein K1719_005511 [Acacia pycnantha]